MSYARSLASCDFANPSAPSVNDPSLPGPGPTPDPTAAALAAHKKAAEQQSAYQRGISTLQPVWAKLPLGPYPPSSDDSDYPRTGDRSLLFSASSISKAALAEPGRVSKGMIAQAEARRPKLTPLFWVGLVCLGTGIYVLQR